MDTYIDSRLITLTSQSATVKNNTTYLSNVEFQLTGLLKEETDIEKVEIQLLNAQIPVSFYTINYTNNLFKIKIDTAEIMTYTITTGNYNANSLIIEMNTQLNHANFHISLDKITGKLSFSHNKSFIIYNDFENSIGSILGFSVNSTNTATGINPYTLSPSYPLNLLGIKRISILSNELPTFNYSSSYNGSCCLLGVIPVDAVLWGMINYHNITNIKHILKVRNIDKIDLQIFDENNNYINFNNCDWSITLSLDITRRNIPKSTTKFNDIIKPIQIPNKDNKNNIDEIEPSQREDFNDLDLLLYNQEYQNAINNKKVEK
jgi:hypothetical protein